MNQNEYKAVKAFLGIKNPDIWTNLAGIAKDTDKSVSCGRLELSEKVRARIDQMTKTQAEATKKMVEKLATIFASDAYTIVVDAPTNDIQISGGLGKIDLVFENDGRDHFGQFIYRARGKGGLKTLFLLYPMTGPVSGKAYGIHDCDWYLWRVKGVDPSGPQLVAYQSYKNEINREVLECTLGIKI